MATAIPAVLTVLGLLAVVSLPWAQQLVLQSCGPEPACLHALGGGLIAPGGGFDQHVTLPQCTQQLNRYAAAGGAYWQEVSLAVDMAFEALQLDPVCDLMPGRPVRRQQSAGVQSAARKLLATLRPVLNTTQHRQQVPRPFRAPSTSIRSQQPALPPPSRDQVVVFDIDETVLSNIQQMLHPDPNSTWDDWVQAAVAPPLLPSRCLYLSLLSAGYSVAFVTGRGEAQRAATAKNLEAAGFGIPCHQLAAGIPAGGAGNDPLCYEALYMRAPGDTRLASVYKPWARQQLLGGTVQRRTASQLHSTNALSSSSRASSRVHSSMEGAATGGVVEGGSTSREASYTLLALVGDQFSDLNGDTAAPYAFKLPNPFYFIL